MNLKNLTVATIGLLVAACGNGSDPAPAPINAAPTISVIADQSTMANQASAPIAFTVTDEQLSSLGLSATSDNQEVVPDTGLVLGGSGGDRTLTVTPTLDRLGDAFITVTVTDQAGLSASTTFLLTIDPQQVSVQQFTRTTFALSADGDPELINAIEFTQDADNDDFADLLAQ